MIEFKSPAEVWDKAAADNYDTPGTGMYAPDALDPPVQKLAALAGGGRALEFAIGTGRVAIPLLEAGVEVSGIEIAPAMVGRLREKISEERLLVVLGDMTTAKAGVQCDFHAAHAGTADRVLSQRCTPPQSRWAVRHRVTGARTA